MSLGVIMFNVGRKYHLVARKNKTSVPSEFDVKIVKINTGVDCIVYIAEILRNAYCTSTGYGNILSQNYHHLTDEKILTVAGHSITLIDVVQTTENSVIVFEVREDSTAKRFKKVINDHYGLPQSEEKNSMYNDATQFTYYRLHKTTSRTGEILLQPIAAMADDHLLAATRQLMNRLKQAIGLTSVDLSTLDPMSRQLLGSMQKKASEKNANQIPFLLALLNAYVSEAVMIRGNVTLIAEYQEAVGRNAKLPFFLMDEQNVLPSATDGLDMFDVVDVTATNQ